ncbi:hypothetical protein D3C72_1494740 [compost metagenome]
MNNTLLDFSLGVAGCNRLREPRQVVHADNENVSHPAIFQLIQHAKPELGGLVLPDPHAQYIFVSVQINANDHVGGLVDNGPVLFDFKVDGIQIDDRVDAL